RVATPGQAFTLETVWRNSAVACLPFRWHPAVYLLDPDRGQPVARAIQAQADPRTWTDGREEPLPFTLSVPAEIKPGRYAVAVGIEDDRGEPAIELGIEGNDGQKRFVLGYADVDS
ncbi:MAG: DUF4832 domain-containing protein, partial [Pirellulaceae bacterium]|nr:DUF4832 domain-containing protein [Pirellulaceae bacterium]